MVKYAFRFTSSKTSLKDEVYTDKSLRHKFLSTCAQTLLWYHVLNKVLIPRIDFTCKLLASFIEVVKFVQH